MKHLFNEKLDVKEFKLEHEKIAKKHEIWQLHQIVANLFKRLKQLSICQAEMAQNMIPATASGSYKASETINEQKQKRDFLAKQSKIIAQWISSTPLGTLDLDQNE